MKLKTVDVKTVGSLIDLVGAGADGNNLGPVVVIATLWDGRKVTATYSDNPKDNQQYAYTDDIIFEDVKPLIPLVNNLLEKNEAFVVILENGDLCLEWAMVN